MEWYIKFIKRKLRILKITGKNNWKCFIKVSPDMILYRKERELFKKMLHQKWACQRNVLKWSRWTHHSRILKKGIVRIPWSLSDLFFLFDLSRIYLPGRNQNDQNNRGGRWKGNYNRCVLYTRFTKYFRNYGEHHYARRNPENKKRPFKRAEAKNCGWIYRNAGQHHGNHTGTCDHPYWRTRAGRYRQSGETTVWLTPSRSRYFFNPAPRTKSDPKRSVGAPSYIGRSKLHS